MANRVRAGISPALTTPPQHEDLLQGGLAHRAVHRGSPREIKKDN